MSEPHCETCICGRRARVQADHGLNGSASKHGPGTITWTEHLEAYAVYSARYGTSQSAETLNRRMGFGYNELTELLGHEPKTWQPIRAGS